MSIVLLLIFGWLVSLWDMCMSFSSAHMQDKRLVLVTCWSSRAQQPGQEAVLLFRLAAVKTQSLKHFPGSPHSCSNKKSSLSNAVVWRFWNVDKTEKKKKWYNLNWKVYPETKANWAVDFVKYCTSIPSLLYCEILGYISTSSQPNAIAKFCFK